LFIALRAEFSDSIEKVLILIFASLKNKLESFDLIRDRLIHILVGDHSSPGFGQVALKALIHQLKLAGLLSVNGMSLLFLEGTDPLLVEVELLIQLGVALVKLVVLLLNLYLSLVRMIQDCHGCLQLAIRLLFSVFQDSNPSLHLHFWSLTIDTSEAGDILSALVLTGVSIVLSLVSFKAFLFLHQNGSSVRLQSLVKVGKEFTISYLPIQVEIN
jgi:hypothetical protein